MSAAGGPRPPGAGRGGGGAMVALCGNADNNHSEDVKSALESSGYEALSFEIGGNT